MKIRKLLVVMLAMLLSACGVGEEMSDSTQILLTKNEQESYDVVVPFEMSATREYHSLYANSSEDFDTIGSRLMELSLDHFPSDSYVLGEGSVITYKRLIQLVGRESDSQEMGLNPRKNEPLDIGEPNVEMVNAVLVNDVVEQDYYRLIEGEYVLSGMSLCIVLNPEQNALRNGKSTTVTLSDDVLFEYGSSMARKLERYMRTLGDSRNIPILITLYVNGIEGSYVPGYMLGKAFFKDRAPNFERINEKWVLFPSSEASKMDSFNTAQFETFKSAMADFIMDDVGIVGKAFYEENTLQKLNITIQYTHKTYVELVGIIRYCATLLETFANDQFDITVHFKNQSETKAIVLKYAGSNESIVVSMN